MIYLGKDQENGEFYDPADWPELNPSTVEDANIPYRPQTIARYKNSINMEIFAREWYRSDLALAKMKLVDEVRRLGKKNHMVSFGGVLSGIDFHEDGSETWYHTAPGVYVEVDGGHIIDWWDTRN